MVLGFKSHISRVSGKVARLKPDNCPKKDCANVVDRWRERLHNLTEEICGELYV